MHIHFGTGQEAIEKVGKALKHLRTKRNLSLDDVADETGIVILKQLIYMNRDA